MNPHTLASASPSSWCVCQFRHPRMGESKSRFYYFLGAGGGVAGALAGADCVSSTDDPPPPLREAATDRLSDVIMKRIAAIVVALERTVAAPRGPNAVWLPIPPKAPAKSAALPLCSNTTRIRNTQASTCTVVRKITIASTLTFQKSTMAAKDFASKLAPPTKVPSNSGWAIRPRTLSGFTLPP